MAAAFQSHVNLIYFGVFMVNSLSSIFEKFIQMDYPHQIIFMSSLLYVISMMARTTYEAGSTKVSKPELLRRYNELLHRISTQQLYIAKGNLDRMPDNVFFAMVAEELEYLGIVDSVIKQLTR